MENSEFDNTFEENEVDDATAIDINDMLITAVQERKILYDAKSNCNKNKLAKEAAWIDIGQGLDKSALWCQTEWKKLKATYGRKKKAIKGKSGQQRQRIELWPHFFSMQFLDDFVLEGSTTSNIGDVTLGSTSENNLISNNVGDSVIEGETPPAQPTKIHKNGRKRGSDKIDEEIINFLNKPKEVHDGHHHFCLGLADQLRGMTKRQCSLAKMKITKVMYEAEYETEDIE